MAKILPGAIVTKISGTIAGTTFQNWRGLLVARAKSTPTNVNTPRQTIIRALMTLLSRAWRDELTQGLRTAWNQRAKNFPWLDVFGNERKMTGENLYIKQNMVLLDHGLVRQDTPVPDIVPEELLDVTADVGPNSLDIIVKGVTAGVITAQAPFINIIVAGGFLSVDSSALPDDLLIETQALPAGRKHQTSDFRHVFYNDDPDLSVTSAHQITVKKPDGQVRNVVVILQRYNKFGNFTQPRVFEGIVG